MSDWQSNARQPPEWLKVAGVLEKTVKTKEVFYDIYRNNGKPKLSSVIINDDDFQ